MVRIFHVYFPRRTLFLAISEGLLSAAALLAATCAWFGENADLAIRYEHGVLRILFAAFVCILCMYYHDLYDSLVVRSFREVASRLMQVLGTACIALAVIYYVCPSVSVDRGPLFLWAFIGGAVLMMWRKLFVTVSASPEHQSRSILLGNGPLALPLIAEIADRPECGLNLIGYVSHNDSEPTVHLPVLGAIQDVAAIVQREKISCVIVSLGDRRGRLPVAELLRLKTQGVSIHDAPDLYEALTGQVPVPSLRLGWLLFSSGFRISPFTLLYKRAASVVLSLVALVITAPLMALIAIAIRLDSPGPVIFRQKRLGQAGRPFTLFKFRSMRVDADPERPAQADDTRITRVGHWIRLCRMDELPQLYNILRGDMYFVGPRPFIPSSEYDSAERIPFYNQRWVIKPGATGWAQVKSGYCSTLAENVEKLGYDLFYIKNISPGLDFLILFHTVKILLLGRGAR